MNALSLIEQSISLRDSRRGNWRRRGFEALRLACPWKESEGVIHNLEIDLGSFLACGGGFGALSEPFRCRQAASRRLAGALSCHFPVAFLVYEGAFGSL